MAKEPTTILRELQEVVTKKRKGIDSELLESITQLITDAYKAIEEKDRRSIVWSVEDFEGRAREREIDNLEDDESDLFNEDLAEQLHEDFEMEIPEENMLYDRSKFQDALESMIHHHDCTIGITWETIDYYLDEECKLEKA
jgi:hypothetical protein